MNFPSYSDSISSSHRKRIIKLPQVNSVSTLLSPVLSNIPTLLREFNSSLLNMLSQIESNEPNNLNEMCNESIDIDTDYENVESFNTGDSEKDFLTSFKKVFNEKEKNENNYDSENESLYINPCVSRNHHRLTEEIIEITKKIFLKLNELNGKMLRNRIKPDDLFKHRTKTYSILSKEKKNAICSLAKFFGLHKIAYCLNISKKSLTRWLKKGTERKKGGGRKILDPLMEEKVLQWYQSNKSKIAISAKIIKQKAKEFSSCRKFLASKGWFEKFRKKYNIKVEKCSKHKKL